MCWYSIGWLFGASVGVVVGALGLGGVLNCDAVHDSLAVAPETPRTVMTVRTVP